MRRWGLVLLVASLATGCARRRKAKAEVPGPLVKRVDVEGVDEFEKKEFLEYLNLRPSRGLGTSNRHYYLPGLEAVDTERIQRLYASHGHYHVEVHRFEVDIRRPDKPLHRQRADVEIALDEGPGTTVRKVQFKWTGALDAGLEQSEIQDRVDIRADSKFTVPRLSASSAAMREALRDAGYPEAQVEHEAWVDKQGGIADVRFVVTPGPRARIGEIEVRGLERVPEELVRREFKRQPGRLYSPKRMREIEAAVYGLEVFNTVTVIEKPVGADGRIDLVVQVDEGKMQRVRFGVGIGIDPVRWEQRGTAEYVHENLFGNLTRMSIKGKAGYAELPALYQPDEHGPVTDIEVEFRKKGWIEDQLVLTYSPTFSLGIWPGYQYVAGTSRVGASRFVWRVLELSTSYNNRWTNFFNISPTLDQNRTILGRDFRDPYALAFWQFSAVLHLTDKITGPSNGVRLGMSYDIASTYLGGMFDYHKLRPDLRAYWRVHPRVQLAGRARVGFIVPYGRNPGAPIDQQFYLGGSNDVRGWPLRQLSPRVESCDAMGDDCEQVPVGGKSMVHGSAELRVRTFGDLWVASFADVGDVRTAVFEIDPGGWMYSVGGGLRYETPIGSLRGDFGYRLNEDPRFEEPRPWAFHIGLGEAF